MLKVMIMSALLETMMLWTIQRCMQLISQFYEAGMFSSSISWKSTEQSQYVHFCSFRELGPIIYGYTGGGSEAEWRVFFFCSDLGAYILQELGSSLLLITGAYMQMMLTHLQIIYNIQIIQSMDKEQDVPEKRFEDYQEVFNSEGQAIGFTLPGSEFLFRYDNNGGWKDEKGNYYNFKGILQKIADGVSDDDDQDQLDDEELDEFQRMLDDEGSSPAKNKKESQPAKKESENYQTGTTKLLENYKNKKNIRQGLPLELHIFFKMRSKYYERVKPVIEKTQSISEANQQVKAIKAQVAQTEKKLKEANKWIEEGGEFEYSGTQLDEATYDRYWYGFIKTNPEKYKEILAEVEKSAEFALLEHKTYYALKSKFYLKQKMQQTIKELSAPLEKVEDDALVKITADNLPENFPTSFLLDLCSFSDTPIDEVFSIEIIDDFKAEIFLSKKAALKFLNVEGYCHEEKEFIQLEVEVDTKQRKLQKTGFYKVSVSTGKDNPYKTHACELNDTLALEKSRQQLVKLYQWEEQKKNGGFRFIVNVKALKRVTMFRGPSLDVIKIEMFEKS